MHDSPRHKWGCRLVNQQDLQCWYQMEKQVGINGILTIKNRWLAHGHRENLWQLIVVFKRLFYHRKEFRLRKKHLGTREPWTLPGNSRFFIRVVVERWGRVWEGVCHSSRFDSWQKLEGKWRISTLLILFQALWVRKKWTPREAGE